jgi:hypothetical protein
MGKKLRIWGSQAAGWLVMIVVWILLSPLYLVVWLWMLLTGRRIWLGR